MSQAGENPPTGAPYTGTGFLILNTAETSATVTATHNIPLNILTGGHIHRGPVGVNGPIIFPFPNPASPVGPLAWAIPTAEVANLKAGLLYMNFHTSTNPAGAIRSPLVRALLAPSATNGAQLAVANALDVSAGYATDLDQILMAEAVASGPARVQALDDLSGRALYVQGLQGVETMVDFEDGLFARAESAGLSAGGVGGFAAVNDAFGRRDASAEAAGSTISRPSILVGIDYGLAPGLTGGLGFGYADAKDSFKGGAGDSRNETTSVQAYLSGVAGPVVMTGAAGYGWSKLDTVRVLGSLGRRASESHNGNVWSLGARLSSPITLSHNFVLSPYGAIDAQRSSINGYAESGAGSVDLLVPRHETDNSAVEAGASLSLPMAFEGGSLTMRLQGALRYRLTDGAGTLATGWEGTPTGFQTVIRGSDRTAAHLAASLTTNLGAKLSASAGYRGLISSHMDTHVVELRLTLKM